MHDSLLGENRLVFIYSCLLHRGIL